MASRARPSLGLLLVGSEKLAEAALLLAVYVGLHRLLGGNMGDKLVRWMQAVRIDPDSKYARAALARMTNLSSDRLRTLRIGTLLYGLLYAVEGVGLLLRQRWAEYVTILTTAGFLPLEAWELYRDPSKVKVVVTILNVAVVIYLIVRLRREMAHSGRSGEQVGHPAAEARQG